MHVIKSWFILAIVVAISSGPFASSEEDVGVMDPSEKEELEALEEYMRELRAEQLAEELEEHEAARDVEVAAAAEAAAKEAERKAEAEARAALKAEAESKAKRKSFYQKNTGASAMKDKMNRRESVGNAGEERGGQGAGGRRSRIPPSSQPGKSGPAGDFGGSFAGSFGGGAAETPEFASLNEQMGNFGGVREDDEEPESRRAARQQLDEATQKAQRRAVATVLRASGEDSGGGFGDGGDHYKVLGLRRNVQDASRVSGPWDWAPMNDARPEVCV